MFNLISVERGKEFENCICVALLTSVNTQNFQLSVGSNSSNFWSSKF